MSIQASEEQRAAAAAYNELHVPALFQQWAPLMLDAVQARTGDRILDVACGTGVLTREAASRVGRDGLAAGLDPNPGMLTVAKELAPALELTEGVAEALPYPPESFDAVVSQFGLMFFHDRAAALSEMARVLRPGGRVAVAVWDSLDNSEAYPDVVALLQKLAGEAAAGALSAPFVMGDKRELTELLEAAGFESVEVATHRGTARFPNIRTMVEADLRGWLPVMGVNLNEDQIDSILKEAELVLAQFVTTAGTMEFSAPAHVVTGQKNQLR